MCTEIVLAFFYFITLVITTTFVIKKLRKQTIQSIFFCLNLKFEKKEQASLFSFRRFFLIKHKKKKKIRDSIFFFKTSDIILINNYAKKTSQLVANKNSFLIFIKLFTLQYSSVIFWKKI